MTPGKCYKISFNDGDFEVFKLLGVDSSGLQSNEVPPNSGNVTSFEERYPGASTVAEVDCP